MACAASDFVVFYCFGAVIAAIVVHSALCDFKYVDDHVSECVAGCMWDLWCV